ncbi:MAG: RDD family protein [Byssovorax sp.]
MSTTGQTLAKRWMGIKVVKMDGSPCGFVHGVLLREFILSGLSLIPYIGTMIGLADAVMIFGDQRRCMHDHIAGTKVVLALRTR